MSVCTPNGGSVKANETRTTVEGWATSYAASASSLESASRVEGWCGNLAVPFPPPARSIVACGFPALRFPACFVPRVMGPIEWKPLFFVYVSGSGTP
jgi:hypothetical protein